MAKKSKSDSRVLWLLAIILLICFMIMGVLFIKYFYSGINKDKYGDRLSEISNYPLSKTLEEDIRSIYTSDKTIDSVEVNQKGRIIYVNIAFNTAVKVDTAKSLAIKSLDKIGEDNLTYYEVQFILTYTGEEENNFKERKWNTMRKIRRKRVLL